MTISSSLFHSSVRGFILFFSLALIISHWSVIRSGFGWFYFPSAWCRIFTTQYNYTVCVMLMWWIIKTRSKVKRSLVGVKLFEFAWRHWYFFPHSAKCENLSKGTHKCIVRTLSICHLSGIRKGETSTNCYFEPVPQSGEEKCGCYCRTGWACCFGLLLSLGRLLGPRGPWWNNQSLTGAGPASASECCVPATINRPG